MQGSALLRDWRVLAVTLSALVLAVSILGARMTPLGFAKLLTAVGVVVAVVTLTYQVFRGDRDAGLPTPDSMRRSADDVLEREYGRLSGLVRYTDDGAVHLLEDNAYSLAIGPYEAVVLYLAGKLYAHEHGTVDAPAVTYGQIMETLDYPDVELAYALDSDDVLRFVHTEFDGTNKLFSLDVHRLPEALDWVLERDQPLKRLRRWLGRL